MNRLGIGIRLRILLQPILALRLALVLALSLAGCGGRPASGTLPEGVLAVQAIPWSSQPDLVGKVMAAFANTRWTTTPTSARDGSKRETFSLGYDHYLSKRTDLYAVYMNDRITSFDRGNSYVAGIRHRF